MADWMTRFSRNYSTAQGNSTDELYERRVNAGAGMLTGNALVGDEERGP